MPDFSGQERRRDGYRKRIPVGELPPGRYYDIGKDEVVTFTGDKLIGEDGSEITPFLENLARLTPLRTPDEQAAFRWTSEAIRRYDREQSLFNETTGAKGLNPMAAMRAGQHEQEANHDRTEPA